MATPKRVIFGRIEGEDVSYAGLCILRRMDLVQKTPQGSYSLNKESPCSWNKEADKERSIAQQERIIVRTKSVIPVEGRLGVDRSSFIQQGLVIAKPAWKRV